MIKVTFKNVKKVLRGFGMTISYNKETGEYRVNEVGGKEATAYYTNDIEDAISTAIHEIREGY